MDRRLTVVTAACGLLYFSELLVLGALEPGYSHMRQFASELGMADAVHPRVFAVWVLAQALLFFVAAWLFFRRVRCDTKRNRLAAAIAIFIALFGVNYLFVAAFPLPDLRHNGYGLGGFTFFAPWLLAWAYSRVDGARRFRLVQLFTPPVLIVLLFFQPGVFAFVDESNLGLFQRVGAGSMYLWLALTGYWLDGFAGGHKGAHFLAG